jgi:hypothetical protein
VDPIHELSNVIMDPIQVLLNNTVDPTRVFFKQSNISGPNLRVPEKYILHEMCHILVVSSRSTGLVSFRMTENIYIYV